MQCPFFFYIYCIENISNVFQSEFAISGPELDKLGEEEINDRVEVARVFYRVTPRHKLKIVKALQVGHQIVKVCR